MSVFCACKTGASHPITPTETTGAAPSTNGPLSASVEPGGKALYAPDEIPYFATYGSYRLCLDAPSGSAQIDGIAFNTRIEPLSITPTLREVPELSDRTGSPLRWTPIGGVIGRPPNFSFGNAGGEFREDYEGFTLDLTCDAIRDPHRAWVELLVVVEVGEQGADIRDFTISYTYLGNRYELLVPWRMTACGSGLPADLCAKP